MTEIQANKKSLTSSRKKELLHILEARFRKNRERHKNISWDDVLVRLENKSEKLWSINEMEKTGGEPDVIDLDNKTGEYIFCDCSAESPAGRKSLCYDGE